MILSSPQGSQSLMPLQLTDSPSSEAATEPQATPSPLSSANTFIFTLHCTDIGTGVSVSEIQACWPHNKYHVLSHRQIS